MVRPLSEGQKRLAYRMFASGPQRRIARQAWRLLLALAIRRRQRGRSPQRGAALSDVTAVIKTFERPRRCRELIGSIRRLYPGLKIIVADDSAQPVDHPGTQMIRLPFDSGVGAGRQAALDSVETEFVLNLDDDFLFCAKTDVGAARDLLRQYPEVDILGGQVIDLPLGIVHDFAAAHLHSIAREPLLPPGTRLGPLRVLDKVPNFFLARTASVKAVGWDPSLRRLDHADFFTRARGRLVTAMWDGWQILHCRDPFDDAYLRFRNDVAADRLILARRYPPPPAP